MKDIVNTRGVRTTFGAVPFRDNVPDHVAYLVIDAVIDVPWARAHYKDAPDDFFIKPSAIADEVWHIAHQDRSAWSFLSEVRPYREVW